MDQQQTTSHYIKEIFNLTPIISTLKEANPNTFIIFDVDEVLIMPTPEHDFRHSYRIKILEKIFKTLTDNQIKVFKSIIFAQRKVKLIEPDINQLFDLIKYMNIPSVALTAMGTGKFGIINNMVEFRIKELSKFSISFESLTPLHDTCIINSLKNVTKVFPEATGSPCLDTGIIFTAGLDKGIILEYVLNKYNYYPKTIIFVDDYLPNLESVKQLCIKLKMNFCGFYYKAATLIPLPQINKKLEVLRFQKLLQEKVWLIYDKINDSNTKTKYLKKIV